jgi:hypothetical protein
VAFHRLLSEVFDWACCVDQLDVTNLVAMEYLFRERQLLEDLKTKNTDGMVEEHAYFRGQQKTMTGACFCPEFTDRVAEGLAKDSELLKQRQKAVELGGLSSGPPAQGGQPKN